MNTGERNARRPASLDAGEILDCAMSLVQEQGIDGLSMRRLGERLGVDPMAIYYHLPNKAAIIRGLVERVFIEIEDDLTLIPASTWQEQTLFWATTYYAVAQRNPQLIVHLIGHAEDAGDTVMRVNECLYAALAGSGLDARTIMNAADLIVDYVHGLTLSTLNDHASQTDWRATFANQENNDATEDYPVIRSVYAELDPDDLNVDVEFGIRVILSGLERLETQR